MIILLEEKLRASATLHLSGTVLHTYVLAHTCNPKLEHYNAVCRKLVDKYPKLQDTEGDTLYVSVTKIISFHVEIDGKG